MLFSLQGPVKQRNVLLIISDPVTKFFQLWLEVVPSPYEPEEP